MRMLTVSLLVCAMMALTVAAAVPEAKLRAAGREEKSPVVSGSTFCPSGWTGYNGRCFLYVPTPRTWADAEKNCLSYDGNLASVHSFHEHHIIQNLILNITHKYPFTWLGGSDEQQEGNWFWSDGTLFTFNYWSPGQPDNHANGNCLVMNFGDQKKFDDQPCYYSKPSVCAINPYLVLG